MRPFVHFARFSRRWYVDVSRGDPGIYPGASWIGYATLGEAMDAARAAYIAEPA